MVAINYTTMRNNLNDYCDLAYDSGETIVVTRKEDRNIVVLSLNQYNDMQKQIRNSEYLAKIDRAYKQLHEGKGQVHDLIEV